MSHDPNTVHLSRPYSPSPAGGLVSFPAATVGELITQADGTQQLRLEANYSAIHLFVEVRT
jgi:hypothetical protein